MVKIHGAVFLVIGILVVVVSYFRENLLFFKYLGAVLIVYGTLKLVFKAITGKDTAKDSLKDIYPQKQSPKKTPNSQQLYSQQSYRTQTFRCRRCGSDIFHNNNFCSNCGMRLR